MGRPNTTGLDHNRPNYQTEYGHLKHEKYKEYRSRYWPKAQKKYKRRRYWLDKYVKSKGCEHCGYNTSAVALDWDHINPTLKSFSIGNKVPGCNLKRLFKEIRKCRILCANCHRIHTHEGAKIVVSI